MSLSRANVFGNPRRTLRAITVNWKNLAVVPLLRKLRKDIGGQVRRDSKENLRNKFLNQQSIFFSQLTDSSSTIRIKREVKLPVLGLETPAPKSYSKTSQAKDNRPLQGWELAQYS